MQAPPSPADGLILLDKPAGMTSHDCVASVRRLLPRKTKVGHAGTLDPFCTGLLLLLIGKGTRLASLLQGMDKTYEGLVRLGQATDTLDRDGRVVAEGTPPDLPGERWQELADGFVGPQMQTPPAYSAKRIGRVRSYALARKGQAVPLAPVAIEIFRFKVAPRSAEDLGFEVRCSSGTYVRSLAAELGAKGGCPAHCHELRRTRVGPYDVASGNALEDPFRASGFLPFDQVDLGLPVHGVTPPEERLLLFGQKVPAPLGLQGHDGLVKVVGSGDRFIALGRLDGRQIQPTVVFP